MLSPRQRRPSPERCVFFRMVFGSGRGRQGCRSMCFVLAYSRIGTASPASYAAPGGLSDGNSGGGICDLFISAGYRCFGSLVHSGDPLLATVLEALWSLKALWIALWIALQAKTAQDKAGEYTQVRSAHCGALGYCKCPYVLVQRPTLPLTSAGG